MRTLVVLREQDHDIETGMTKRAILQTRNDPHVVVVYFDLMIH